MAAPSPNLRSGYGFVQADAAFALIPKAVPAPPTLTLAASSVVLGSSTLITWSEANATGCSGALASSGTQTLTPTAAATDAYSLTCANAAGSSAPSSVNLTVTAPASSGGGGAADLANLLGLAGIGVARILRLRASRANLGAWNAE